MATPSLIKAIGKLAVAGEQAGFSVEQMIEMLNSGVAYVTWRFNERVVVLRSGAALSEFGNKVT
jgi:hypothetical protein